ncbi:MAG: HAD family hydrolase [Candidatus Woesearchaeota archaeon]
MKALIFDVDGTLYDKHREYRPGKGSINDAHNFFRQEAYKRALEGISDENRTIDEIVSSYKQHVSDNTVIDIIEPEILSEFKDLVDKYGSNGKVFADGFGTDSSFLSTMISSIDFVSILAPDQNLIDTIEYLKSKDYTLGIMTTEAFSTVENAAEGLGLELVDFYFSPHPELEGKDGMYPIICAENTLKKKPSLEPFQKILDVTGYDPHEVTYIGDVKHKDIDPALSLGMDAVHVNRKADKITRSDYYEVPTIYALREVF